MIIGGEAKNSKMKLFAGLRKLREFEKAQLPFLRSVIDFDIVIEIGYEQERSQPMTVKQLLLLDICSRATARRKLARLIEVGIIIPRKTLDDRRATKLVVAPSAIKLFGKYGGAIAAISVSHFK
ncbi:MAG: hypothetical protein ABJC66_05780 [Gammaproteobacteria bacterium]